MVRLLKRFAVSFLLFPLLVLGQSATSTPNVGLKIPAFGSLEDRLILGYDLNRLDLFLSGNTATAPTTWNSTTTYSTGQVVAYRGTFYTSLSNGNISNLPTNTSYWSSAVGATSSNVPSLSTTNPQVFSGAVGVPKFTLTNQGVFVSGQMGEYGQSLINGCSPQTEFQRAQGSTNFATEALTGCITVPASSTQYQVQPVAGYISNSSTSTVAVGGTFTAAAIANNVTVFAQNSVAEDIFGLTSGITLLNENTFQVNNPPSAYTANGGVTINLNGVHGATSGVYPFNAFTIASGLWNGTTFALPGPQFTNGILLAPGSVSQTGAALNIGASNPATPSSNYSSPYVFVSHDSTSVSGSPVDGFFFMQNVIGSGSGPFHQLTLARGGSAPGTSNFIIGSYLHFGMEYADGTATLLYPSTYTGNGSNHTIFVPAATDGTLMVGSNNLSDVASPSTALSNLLGNPGAGAYSIHCTSSTSCAPTTSSPGLPSVAPTTYSGTTSTGFATIYTPASAGRFRVCGFLDVTVAATASTTSELAFQYVSDGHTFDEGITVTGTTQWSNGQGCFAIYSDASQPIQWEIYLGGVTGTPTYRYWVTLEQM